MVGFETLSTMSLLNGNRRWFIMILVVLINLIDISVSSVSFMSQYMVSVPTVITAATGQLQYKQMVVLYGGTVVACRQLVGLKCKMDRK